MAELKREKIAVLGPSDDSRGSGDQEHRPEYMLSVWKLAELINYPFLRLSLFVYRVPGIRSLPGTSESGFFSSKICNN